MKKIFSFLIIQLLLTYSYGQVTGIIVDENNYELPGVSIQVQGTTTGVITNIEGEFEIDAKVNDTLIFSFIGFEMQKIAVQNAFEKLSITLQPVLFDIGELVVLGYSNKTKTEISSAVTVLSAEKLNDTPSNDIGGLLQGKVAGVQVISNSGAPGSGSQVRIRGVSTIKPGNAEPLYVVDGIIGGAFDPNDVESLTVLKDAGATGMYGARANKGVIVITTKSAKSGITNFEFKSSYGYNIADHGNIQMMNGQEFYELSSELYRDYETHQIDKIRFYEDYPRALEGFDYNWLDEAFKPAATQKYYLSASGNTEKLGYYLSGNYSKEDGTFANTGYERLNLRANTNYQFNQRVSMKNNINLSASNGSSYDYMSLYYTYLGVPWDNPFNTDGSPRFIDGAIAKKVADGTGWWSRDPINPFHSEANSENKYKDFSASYDLVLNVKILNWLSFSSSNRIGFSTSKGHNFVSPLVAGTYYNKGFVAQNQSLWFGGLSTNLLRFNKQIANHSIDGLVGFEIEQGNTETLSANGVGLPQGLEVPSVASSQFEVAGFPTTDIYRSLISQVSYNYIGTYFLTGSYRIDRSSTFPSKNRTAKFPALSASVLVNNMTFMSNVSAINMLKVRASYGITADPEIGPGKFLPLIALNSQYNGNPTATPYQLGNEDLTWEKTKQLNIGIDLDLFDRISLNIDAYNSVTEDLIILAAQPLSIGFESRYENSGSVLNKGIELALSTVNVQKGDFRFTTDFVFSANSNELSGIDSPIISTVGGVTQIYQDGAELYTFYLPKWLGVDPETGGPLWEKVSEDGTAEETSLYSEANPQMVGSALPKFTGGISASIDFKNISFYVNGAYQHGNKVYNGVRIMMDSDGHEPYYNNMLPRDDWSRWEKPGDIATHPSMQNNSLSKENSSRFLEDGSFFKIRTMSLQYRLPKTWVSSIKLKEVSLTLTGNNLFTWTKYWGQDPEVTLNKESWSMPGVNDFKYPNSKQYIMSLNVKF